ncbi:MAG: exodeoxyribonuclease VII small subunit [Acutalibacteraceae bacterium]|jgi:exodeoxyribonuclease VII small subunit
MAENKISFEESLSSLENIVARLESGECSLEESIKLFEKGMKNINLCREALKNAQKRILSLTEFKTENETDA